MIYRIENRMYGWKNKLKYNLYIIIMVEKKRGKKFKVGIIKWDENSKFKYME